MHAVIAIPVRLGSGRFPGKPLVNVGGLPLIAHVALAATDSGLARSVIIVTEDAAIKDAVRAHTRDVEVELWPGEFRNGTERVADFVRAKGWGRGVRVALVQGDDPTITGRDIDLAIACSEHHDVTTLVSRRPRRVTKDDVLATVTPLGVVIEWQRAGPQPDHHVGVYVTSVELLGRYLAHREIPQERVHRLEQLRWERLGVTVRAVRLPVPTQSINRAADIPLAEKILCQRADSWAARAGRV